MFGEALYVWVHRKVLVNVGVFQRVCGKGVQQLLCDVQIGKKVALSSGWRGHAAG